MTPNKNEIFFRIRFWCHVAINNQVVQRDWGNNLGHKKNGAYNGG